MICEECKQKLIVQQTVRYPRQGYVHRRRYCPLCDIVYMTEERVVDKYYVKRDTDSIIEYKQNTKKNRSCG